MIFDTKNSLWKPAFGTFWQTFSIWIHKVLCFFWEWWFLTIDFAIIPYCLSLIFFWFRIASGDWKGFLRIWTIKDLLQETEQHLLSSYRKKKSKIEAQAQTALDMGLKAKFSSEIKIEPMEFVEHRSTYSHRNHITMAILDAFRVITCSRDQTVLIQDFSKMI